MIRLFILLIIPGFLYSQKLIEKTPPINMRLIQYHYLNKDKLITLTPIDRIKITFKGRANFKSISSKINVNELIVGELQGAFADVDASDYIGIVRYDLRVKYYVNYRWRCIARMQFLGVHRNMYTAGVQVKLKPKKHKPIIEV